MAYNTWGEAMLKRQDPLKDNDAITQTMWERMTASAEKYNEPGKFTAFIGFEWTSTPNGNNLHRNVIFRDGKDKADQIIPISQYDSGGRGGPVEVDGRIRAEDRRQGAGHPAQRQPFVRPDVRRRHVDHARSRSTATTPQRRMRWEPIYEVTQMKGDGEAHPGAFAER